MTQVLLNTVNTLTEMMDRQSSLVSVDKFGKNVQNKVDINDKTGVSETSDTTEVSGMDKSVGQDSTDFDKVFNKQLEKESPTSIGDMKSNNIEVENTVSLNCGEVNDYKNDWAASLSELREFIYKVTDEAGSEDSLDLTLARDINELINQLKEIPEETADTLEPTTEEACTAVVAELLSDSESAKEEDSDVDLDSEELINEAEISNNSVYEQLMAYVNKVEIPKTEVEDVSKSNSDTDSALELNPDAESSDVELSNEIIDLSTELLTNDNTVKTDVKTQTNEIEIPLDEDELKELNIESIRAESQNSDDNSYLTQHQSPEEHSVKAMLNQDLDTFEINLDKTVEPQNIEQPQAKPVEVSSSRIMEQITKHIEGLQNNSKVNIVLNPESLGKVTIQLLKTGEGLSAQFTVSSQEVKDMLMKGLDGLKDTLTAQGVGVDNVTVKLADAQESSNDTDWTEQEGSRGGNKEQGRSNKDEKQKGLFEQMLAQTNEENGNV